MLTVSKNVMNWLKTGTESGIWTTKKGGRESASSLEYNMHNGSIWFTNARDFNES